MSKMKKLKDKWGLTLYFVFYVVTILMITFGVIFFAIYVVDKLGLIDLRSEDGTRTPMRIQRFLFILFVGGTLIGTLFTTLFSKKALQPIRKVIQATREVSSGNFDVQLELTGVNEFEELSTTFNKMTEELNSIETLRSDFVSNFSHEFKTPIVSIRGFAKLLKNDENLTETEKQEYLGIIINESERLATLSSNILTLSKYENIEIITDKKAFRLDEQIRRAVLVMAPRWEAKRIQMNIDLEEVLFEGNEDITQQIWLNLIDNAIKFSPEDSQIDIHLIHHLDTIHFSIQDEGKGMDEQAKRHIFDKFYQGDTSHATSGNGLGLAMVKRIVALCHGTITVESEQDQGSTFTVTLSHTD